MAKAKPSLSSLAIRTDPLSELNQVIERLQEATAESRCLEWKRGGLFGPGVTDRTKYRTVKAAISFANADGGFILFGVDSGGTWEGLSDAEVTNFDPANVIELINSTIFPELPNINYAVILESSKRFVVIHIPPSHLAPHVTTKEVSELDANRRKRSILAKGALYYRQGAKSDLATPIQHQKIIERRIGSLRDELVRRVREVPIAVLTQGQATGSSHGISGTIARLTTDPAAPAVRVTRTPGQAAGVLLHEELSNGLFDEINNVIDANKLLAGASGRFVLGDEVYYRVYAERQHVLTSPENVGLLVKTAFLQYSPVLFWATLSHPSIVAKEILAALTNPKQPHVGSAIRAIVLLGAEPTSWLNDLYERKYRRLTQPPEFFWTLKKIVNRTGIADRRLLAMRTTASAVLQFPDDLNVRVGDLLDRPEEAANHLSRICLKIFEGDGTFRPLSRLLDIAAYGRQVEIMGGGIWRELSDLARS